MQDSTRVLPDPTVVDTDFASVPTRRSRRAMSSSLLSVPDFRVSREELVGWCEAVSERVAGGESVADAMTAVVNSNRGK